MNPKHVLGIKFALLTALISGLANFFNKEIIVSGINPVTLTAFKNGLVGLAFIGVVLPLIKKQKLQKADWLKFIAVAVIGGGVPFILFFKGLAMSTAVKGSFIHKTLFIWVALWSLMFLKEKLNKYQFTALAILSVGILAAINFKFFIWGRGEIMILIATLFWSVEIILVKKFMEKIDFRLLAAARMALGTFIIFIYGAYSGSFTGVYGLTALDWLKILIVGAFLFGYVFTWFRALSLAPAGLVTSVLTLAFPVTIIASSMRSFSLPTFSNLTSSFLIIAGIILFIQSFLVKWQLKPKTLTE